MKTNIFKPLFWIVTVIFTGLYVALGVKIWSLDFSIFGTTVVFLLFLFLLAAVVAISIFVYKDAPKRGMNKWMWMLLAAYLPNFIGIIIYAVIRNNKYKDKCINCGEEIDSNFKVCPYCGEYLKSKCDKCGKNISSDWEICPYCENKLRRN